MVCRFCNPATAFIALLLSVSALAAQDILFEDFESSDYKSWTITGAAFGSAPVASENVPAHLDAFVPLGNRAVYTHVTSPNGATDTGKLTSPVFTVSRKYIHFSVCGGQQPTSQRVRLLDANTLQELRTATGTNTHYLKRKSWDVANLMGRSVKIEVEDGVTNTWRVIGIDHIVFSDNPTTGFPGMLAVERWNDLNLLNVSDLVQQDSFYEPYNFANKDFGGSKYRGVDRFSGARLRGYITAPETGVYTFWVSGTTSAQLWLSTDHTKSRKRLLAGFSPNEGTGSLGTPLASANQWDKFPSQMSEEVLLQAGEKYFVELLSQQVYYADHQRHVSFAWARPGGDRELVPDKFLTSYAQELIDGDDDYLPDVWEISYGLDSDDNGLIDRNRQGERGDFDLDGLNNREEYVLGTDPTNADSDGDGLADGDEVRSYGTDPNTIDAPSETLVANLDLATASGNGITATMTSQGLIPSSFRGELSWDFILPTDGHWMLNILTSLMGDLYLQEAIDFDLSIDGVLVARKNLAYGKNHQGILRLLTPHLSAGTHTLTLKIDNLLARRTVSLLGIQVLEPGGPDLDADGTPDWIMAKLDDDHTIFSYSPFSRTSPAFLEGFARMPTHVSINGGSVRPGIDLNHWYADLPLNPGATTTFTAAFDAILSKSGGIYWEPTNVLDSETLLIRKGDSLLLSVQPQAGSSGQSAILTLPEANLTQLPSVTASQSSTGSGGIASRAIDSNTFGKYSGGSVTHTQNVPASWWKVNLGQERIINAIQLWNRTDSASMPRLSNFRVAVINSSGVVADFKDFYKETGHVGESELWELNAPVAGVEVVVSTLGPNRVGSEIISLAEVEVFGHETVTLNTDTQNYVLTFDRAGTQLISASHAGGESGTLTVDVKQANFSSTPLDLMSGRLGSLMFQAEHVDTDLNFDGGESIYVHPNPKTTETEITLRLSPSGPGLFNLAARLFENGPILATQPINVMGITDAIENDLTTSSYHLDYPGYRLVTTPIVATGLPPGGSLVITIFRSGVTFLDGTTTLTLTEEDFTNGIYNLEFLFPENMEGGYCHYVDVYDRDGNYLGRK